MTLHPRLTNNVRTTPNGCIEWTRSTGHGGYGQVMVEKRLHMPHRLQWSFANGPIPAGMFVCHRCDNRLCVNLEHLFIASPAENSADMVSKGRSARGARVGNARLTEPDVVDIRTSFEAGETARELLGRYPISEANLYRVLSGQTWSHVVPAKVARRSWVKA